MKALLVVIFVLMGLCFMALIAAIVSSVQHEKDLRENGCQKQVEAETGKRTYCGKACSRPEKVVVYECAGGQRRVEFQ